MEIRIQILLIFICIQLQKICCLKLTSTYIPFYGVFNQQGKLECYFDLELDKLYVLKWYKDGREFFRYSPNFIPTIQVFPLEGVYVNYNLSTANHVHLDRLTKDSEGMYTCEIVSESPSFHTLQQQKYMKIMVLPELGPKITNVHPWYNVGDNFTAKCIVKKTFPKGNIHWYVNDELIDGIKCKCITEIPSTEMKTSSGQILYNSTSQLNFSIDPNNFRDGTMSIKCSVSFPNSTINLQNVVISNVKTGLGLQQFVYSLAGSKSERIHALSLFNSLISLFLSVREWTSFL